MIKNKKNSGIYYKSLYVLYKRNTIADLQRGAIIQMIAQRN